MLRGNCSKGGSLALRPGFSLFWGSRLTAARIPTTPLCTRRNVGDADSSLALGSWGAHVPSSITKVLVQLAQNPAARVRWDARGNVLCWPGADAQLVSDAALYQLLAQRYVEHDDASSAPQYRISRDGLRAVRKIRDY